MVEAHKRSVDLSDEDRDFVDELVQRGEFGSPQEVVSAGLSALRKRKVDLERRIVEEILPVADAMDADPSLGVPAEQVFAELRERHKARFKIG